MIKASELLGLSCIQNYIVRLEGGAEVVADCYMPNFSNSSGILIYDSAHYEAYTKHRDELIQMGFGGSSWDLYDEDLASFDLEGFKEMFSEWGWTGDEHLKPDWIDDSWANAD